MKNSLNWVGLIVAVLVPGLAHADPEVVLRVFNSPSKTNCKGCRQQDELMKREKISEAFTVPVGDRAQSVRVEYIDVDADKNLNLVEQQGAMGLPTNQVIVDGVVVFSQASVIREQKALKNLVSTLVEQHLVNQAEMRRDPVQLNTCRILAKTFLADYRAAYEKGLASEREEKLELIRRAFEKTLLKISADYRNLIRHRPDVAIPNLASILTEMDEDWGQVDQGFRDRGNHDYERIQSRILTIAELQTGPDRLHFLRNEMVFKTQIKRKRNGDYFGVNATSITLSSHEFSVPFSGTAFEQYRELDESVAEMIGLPPWRQYFVSKVGSQCEVPNLMFLGTLFKPGKTVSAAWRAQGAYLTPEQASSETVKDLMEVAPVPVLGDLGAGSAGVR